MSDIQQDQIIRIPVKKVRIIKVGNSYGVLIPHDYIDNGLLNERELIDLEIKKRNALYQILTDKLSFWV